MPIKFQCPTCERWLTVPDELAGKKGKCKTCNRVVTVPAARPEPSSSNGASKEAKPPPAAAADLEAEAAALLADRPAEEPGEAPQTVDFNCPSCDAELHLGADLAGKNAPCPECKRIIKVPQLAKRDPSQWRQTEARKPSLAKPTGEAPPADTWSSRTPGVVSREALVEAAVIPKKKRPRTLTQKLFVPVLALTVVVGGVGGTWWWFSSKAQQRQEHSLQEVKEYVDSEAARKQIGPAGQAALLTALGDHTLRTGGPSCGPQARDRYGKALTLLREAPVGGERDAALVDLALSEVALGGAGDDVRQKETHIAWEETQKMLRATLGLIGSPEGRLEALRAVARRLIDGGQAERVLPLTSQIYTSPEADKAEAFAAVGLEFLGAGDQARAEKAAELALTPYRSKTPPPVRAGVVTLALALDKTAPKPGKAYNEEAYHRAGEIEGLGRQGKWDKARERAVSDKDKYGPANQFRALLAVATAATDAKTAEAAADVEAAVAFINKEANRDELTWAMRRLVEVGQRAGVSDERLRALADGIPDRALRARAQLRLLQGTLDRTKQAAEENLADQVEGPGAAHLLAEQALARHNTKRDTGWVKNIPALDQPRRSFASVGAALGLQDRDKGGKP